jgi:hypothetical protein
MQRAFERLGGAFSFGNRTFFQHAQGISHFPVPLSSMIDDKYHAEHQRRNID